MVSRQPTLPTDEASYRSRPRLLAFAAVVACGIVLLLVALAVHRRMNTRLANPASLRALTVIPAPAREAYLRGLYFLELQTGEGIYKSIPEFEMALHKEPTFAAAYARLAQAHTYLGLSGDTQREMALARSAADRAIRLNGTSAEAHEALAMVYAYGDWNWERAEAEYKEALRLRSQSRHQPQQLRATQGYSRPA